MSAAATAPTFPTTSLLNWTRHYSHEVDFKKQVPDDEEKYLNLTDVYLQDRTAISFASAKWFRIGLQCTQTWSDEHLQGALLSVSSVFARLPEVSFG